MFTLSTISFVPNFEQDTLLFSFKNNFVLLFFNKRFKLIHCFISNLSGVLLSVCSLIFSHRATLFMLGLK